MPRSFVLPKTGIRASIYDYPGGNCSNNGISARCKDVTVMGICGPELGFIPIEQTSPFEPNEEAPAVILIVREIGGSLHVHAESPDGRWAMAGGAFIYTSDSRFHDLLRRAVRMSGFAVSLHDRIE